MDVLQLLISAIFTLFDLDAFSVEELLFMEIRFLGLYEDPKEKELDR